MELYAVKAKDIPEVQRNLYAVKAKDIPEVQKEYTDIWELVKRFYQVQEDGAYWECVCQEASAYYKKHPTPNAKGLVIQFLEELEQRRNTIYGIDEKQQQLLRQKKEATVCRWLGGKTTKAFYFLEAKVLQECERDFQDYFYVDAKTSLKKSRFEEALSYLEQWEPSNNTKLLIQSYHPSE